MGHRRSLIVLVVGFGIAVGWMILANASGAPQAGERSGHEPRSALATAPRRWVALGRSVDHRPIRALELPGAGAGRTGLVVGAIHGDETAGTRVVRALARGGPLPGIDIWIVPTANPDGMASNTRQNRHRVDLNRNFPWHWKALGRPGDQQYSGPRALSEPESRIMHRLILRLRPAVTIWFHQPLGITDAAGGDPAVERRFAAHSGLPLRRLPRYPGSASTWQNHRLGGTTAFVVELPAGHPSRRAIVRYARAVRATLAVPGGR